MGYGLGGINWDATAIGVMLGGHLHATFTLITIIFVICVFCTITSFKEIPLELLERDEYQQLQEQMVRFDREETSFQLELKNIRSNVKRICLLSQTG